MFDHPNGADTDLQLIGFCIFARFVISAHTHTHSVSVESPTQMQMRKEQPFLVTVVVVVVCVFRVGNMRRRGSRS